MTTTPGDKWPSYLLERALRPPDPSLGVVPGSTPVVAFGDPLSAAVATLGINPSSAEFLDNSGLLLTGSARRLATLESLGVSSHEQLTENEARTIVDDCASYFDRRPYRWFAALDDILRPALDASYHQRSACHLDLVQWATKPLWGALDAETQDTLLRQDVTFLRAQLRRSPFEVVLVNGRSVMTWIESVGLVRWQPAATIEGPPTTTVSLADFGDTVLVGWSCNLQSQHGAHRHGPALAEFVANHARGGPSPAPALRPATTPAPATPRPRASAPVTPARGDDTGLAKGLRFSNRQELVAHLSRWLEHSSHDTIGVVGNYGGKAWVTVESEAGDIAINSDTKRDAVEAFVDSARRPRSYDWLVVKNRTGKVNKVLFSEDRTEGWYAYLRHPLDHEAQLGGAPPAQKPRDAQAANGGHPPDSRRQERGDTPVRKPSPTSRRPPLPHVREGTGEAAIVQFPLPGGEHAPSGPTMPWSTGNHRRKFLASPGRYIDSEGRLHSGDLTFWGEWEPPSRVIERWPQHRNLPTVLHQPYWATPEGGAERQNTDPWVFGDAFLYSNCKQLTPAKDPSALQTLTSGAIILFGSGLDGAFVLDTVFVVADIVGTYCPALRDPDLSGDPAFQACTLDSLATLAPAYSTATFTLYRGATVDEPVNGTYSFSPCRPRDRQPRFPRPPIELPGIVNPKGTQSPSGAKQLHPPQELAGAWADVVRQVRDHGLDLGVSFDTPPKA